MAHASSGLFSSTTAPDATNPLFDLGALIRMFQAGTPQPVPVPSLPSTQTSPTPGTQDLFGGKGEGLSQNRFIPGIVDPRFPPGTPRTSGTAI